MKQVPAGVSVVWKALHLDKGNTLMLYKRCTTDREGEACMKWTEPIRDFAHAVNVQTGARERGEHQKEKTPLLTMREPSLKAGFDVTLAIRLIVSALLFSAVLAFRLSDILSVFLLALSALIAGYDLIIGSILRLVRLRQYDERILVFLVSLLAFLFIKGFEGAAVMILYQFGSLLKCAVAGNIRNADTERFSEQPQTVNVLRGGKEYMIGVRDVSVGETVVIDPGETVAFDSIVVKGESSVDMSALSGEDTPVQVEAGDVLLAGSRNLNAVLYVEVRARAGESSAEKILKLINSDKAGQGRTEHAVSRFCAVYTPVMILLTVALAVLYPLLTHTAFSVSLYRALIMLLVAGSASFTLFFPVLYHAAISNAAKHGIVFKSRNAVDMAASVDTVVFDQSGTLTYGRLRVSSVKAAKYDPETLLKIAAHAAAYSEQPLAKTIVSSYSGTIYIELIGQFQDCENEGVSVTVDGVEIVVGTSQLLRRKNVFVPDFDMSPEIAWYISIAGIYAGRIIFADDIKADAGKAIQDLYKAGYDPILFTESAGSENENNFRKLGLNEIQYTPSYEEKAGKLKELQDGEERGSRLLYVGSGSSNSTPYLEATLSAAMSSIGQESKTNEADILILSEKTAKIMETLKSAKNVRKLTIENVTLIVLVKLLVLILAILGKNLLWIAVLTEMIAELLTILQAKRIRH